MMRKPQGGLASVGCGAFAGGVLALLVAPHIQRALRVVDVEQVGFGPAAVVVAAGTLLGAWFGLRRR